MYWTRFMDRSSVSTKTTFVRPTVLLDRGSGAAQDPAVVQNRTATAMIPNPARKNAFIRCTLATARSAAVRFVFENRKPPPTPRTPEVAAPALGAAEQAAEGGAGGIGRALADLGGTPAADVLGAVELGG